MFPEAQPYTYDYYVGVRLSDDEGEVFGYCRKHDFNGPDDFGYGVPTMWKYLNTLSPIDDLIKHMEIGESEIIIIT
jgi:hypothetical protein